jgi:hypothetical protein
MFTYMTPLMSGSAREYSDPYDSFWCCVLSGMESHAKHGDSVWWEGGDTLFVNLYVPSTATWAAQRAEFEMTTRYPYEGEIAIKLKRLNGARTFALALRVPAWAKTATVKVNGQPAVVSAQKGYAVVRRSWRAGDTVTLSLPLELRTETAPGDAKTIAFLRGPMVMAADLGPADKPFEGDAPALVGTDVAAALTPVDASLATFRSAGIGRPADMTFSPFYNQYDRRSAVYFHTFNDAEWAQEEANYRAEQAREKDLAARSVDVMHLGEMQPERDHNLSSDISYPVAYRGRNGRDARTGGFFAFEMKVRPDVPLTLEATYWGEERNRDFYISVDGTRIAHETLDGRAPGTFVDRDYPIPPELTKGKTKVMVRFDPEPGHTAGPVFGCRIYTPASKTA